MGDECYLILRIRTISQLEIARSIEFDFMYLELLFIAFQSRNFHWVLSPFMQKIFTSWVNDKHIRVVLASLTFSNL